MTIDNSDSVNNGFEDIHTLMKSQDGTEFVVSDKGVPYATIQSTARMCGVDEQLIHNAMTGLVPSISPASLNAAIKAEVVTPIGLRSTRLLDSATVYHLVCRYNSKLALTMSRAGATVYMLRQAGCQTKAVEVEPKPVAELSRLEILELAIESEKKALALAAQIKADTARIHRSINSTKTKP
jgi:hypothetical protein